VYVPFEDGLARHDRAPDSGNPGRSHALLATAKMGR
jgi:hypothetical protein